MFSANRHSRRHSPLTLADGRHRGARGPRAAVRSRSGLDADDRVPVGRVLVGVRDPHQEGSSKKRPTSCMLTGRPAADFPTGRASAG